MVEKKGEHRTQNIIDILVMKIGLLLIKRMYHFSKCFREETKNGYLRFSVLAAGGSL